MENKIKHLEFIQNTITRLSTHSFTLKGLCVSVIAAVFAFSFDGNSDMKVFLTLLIPIFSLWFLDAYFLKFERSYRLLYDHVRSLRDEEIDFSMDTSLVSQPSYFSCLFSKTEFIFYGALFAFALLIFAFIFFL